MPESSVLEVSFELLLVRTGSSLTADSEDETCKDECWSITSEEVVFGAILLPLNIEEKNAEAVLAEDFLLASITFRRLPSREIDGCAVDCCAIDCRLCFSFFLASRIMSAPSIGAAFAEEVSPAQVNPDAVLFKLLLLLWKFLLAAWASAESRLDSLLFHGSSFQLTLTLENRGCKEFRCCKELLLPELLRPMTEPLGCCR
jgi:hypothetical protein